MIQVYRLQLNHLAEPKHSAERGFQPNSLSQPNAGDDMIGQFIVEGKIIQ